MADTTTELEVLDQIVDVLGGTSGQYETVVPTLQQILALLGGGGGSGSGYNPSLSVGRADALTGADETSQWAQRVTEGSGSATVRSVQGATVAWAQMVVNGNFASSTGWGSQQSSMSVDNGECTLTSTGQGTFFSLLGATPRPVLYANHKYLGSFDVKSKTANVRMGLNAGNTGTLVVAACTTANANTWTHVAGIIELDNVDYYTVFPIISNTPGGSSTEIGDWFTVRNIMFFDLTAMFGSGNEPSTVAEFEAMYPEAYYPYSAPTLKPVQIAGIQSTDAQGGELDGVEWETQTLRAAGSVADVLYSDHVDVNVGERAYQSGDESDATVRTDGTTTYYPLVTPTTTPISPALPMTYRVQAGGSESIIVPAGEISAIPVLTIAEGESAAELVMDALACIAAPDGPTATANHSVGTYLTMQGKLYKVTSAIAVGESIVAGTNVTQTTVMGELIARTA